MNNQNRSLLDLAIDSATALLETLHKLAGRMDAQADFRPDLRFVGDDRKELPFPGNAKKPLPEQAEAIFLPSDVGTSEETEQGFVEFTQKEILSMPQKFRKLIIVNRKRCRMRRRPCGDGYTYEIRFRSDGYNISASGKTVELAKANMLQKLRNAKPKDERKNGISTIFEEFAIYYFERFRRPKVAEQTFINDEYRLKKHIIPAFGKKKLRQITPSDCENLIRKLHDAGKGKTADEIRSILSSVFKGAIAHGLIERNPLDVVPHIAHAVKHGKALSDEEIEFLFERLHGSHFETVYALALYTGLRPNELKTATVRDGLIVAINSKRHKKETVYKRIPICKRLAGYLDKIDGSLETFPWRGEKYYSMRFPSFCPEHKLYDLRTTFYSKCKELGVAEPALKAYMGHSNGKLGNSYTDLSDTYLLKEGKKLDEW